MRHLRGVAVPAVAFLWLMGLVAVPSPHAADTASRALQQGDYAQAVTLLREQLASQPRSARLQRELGIALLKNHDATGAVTALRAAREIEPRNQSTLYFLGSAAEAAKDTMLALDAYRACLAAPGARLGPVRSRVDALLAAQMRRAMAQAIANERQLSLDDVPMNTLAVPEFALAGSDSLRPICRGLAAIMLTDLRKVPDLRLVERERLPVLLQELALAGRGPVGTGPRAVEDTTAPLLGKLLGARRFAQGTLLAVGGNRLELHGAVIDASAGEVRGTGAPVAGPLTTVLDLEKKLVFQVLDTLGVKLDPSVRRAIGVPVTRRYSAFLAFCRGLEYEAQGRSGDATAAYREALQLDPRFTMAQERFDVVAGPVGGGSFEQNLIGAAVSEPPSNSAPQQLSTEALGYGPSTGPVSTPSVNPRVDEPTRSGAIPPQPLPGFPGPPRRPPGNRGSPR